MDPREDVCRRARPLGAAVLAAVLAVSAPAAAQVKPERAAPDLDARGAIGRALAQRPGAALAEQDAALEALRAAAPALRVRWSALTGAPSRIQGLDLPLAADGDRDAAAAARRVLEQSLALLNLGPDDVRELPLASDFWARATCGPSSSRTASTATSWARCR